MRGFFVPYRKNTAYSLGHHAMNHDHLELQKFNNIADDWWNPNGPFRPLHDLNPIRLQWIAKQIPIKNKTILDIGCGGGILSEAMARQNAHVTGIDLAHNVLEVAKKHSRDNDVSLRYLAISAEELAQKEPSHYDIVTCMELLEHVPDPGSIVHACARLVKPGGYVFFATLNRNLKSLLYAIIGAEYIMRLLPAGTHQFEKFITPAELACHVRSSGMIIRAITGVTCNLLAQNFRLTDNTDINYMLACTKLL